MSFAINHVTIANSGFRELVALSADLGCVGVEVRNDLAGTLFDGIEPPVVRQLLNDKRQRLLALAELVAFNDFSDQKLAEAVDLCAIATDFGAEAVSLIPRNDGHDLDLKTRTANLKLALRELKPVFEQAGLTAFVEPLGFESSSIRYKHEVVSAIEALDASGTYKLVHDTFHHCLADEKTFFPGHTGIVHVSGVSNTSRPVTELLDEDRVLVSTGDRLGNIEQLEALHSAGYAGPVSFEVFAPEVHALARPFNSINNSMEHIASVIRRSTIENVPAWH
ncbi:hypothetical protein AB833_32515 [Chromatiales bacterium (ex Bugula neritina AB1)]|nr:hypothetical protein AB833_32515 [Chromatiales bacterium (ex Bugula neritina AB1)]